MGKEDEVREIIPEEEVMVTSIIQLPTPEMAILSLQSQAQQLLAYAERRVIISDNEAKVSTNDLSIIALAKKALEEKRKEYTTPLNDNLKYINNTFKLVSDPLNQADKITRDKILAYRAEQERKRKEAEEINRQKIELARREAELNNGEFTVDITPVEVAPVQPKHINAELGTAGQAMIRKWDVSNFSQVPDEYKMVDSTKIGKVVRAGIPSIPGIKIWEEPTLRVTTR